jgi:hypothetical protein
MNAMAASNIATSMSSPAPVRSRRNSAATMANAAVWPVSVSTTGNPTRIGSSPCSPLSDIMPLVACTMLSMAGQSRRGLCCP